MESNFNFSFIDLALLAEQKPLLMVMWSAFGVPLAAFVVGMLLVMLRKLKIRSAFKTDTLLLLLSLITITWLVGFLTQIVMLFTQVSGLRMLIIWIIMLICYLGFILFNKKMILKWAKSSSPFDKFSKLK